jgi:hypothetical protein
MSYLLQHLETKSAIDEAIRGIKDKVLILRFGRASDIVCMQLDDIVSVFYLIFCLFVKMSITKKHMCVLIIPVLVASKNRKRIIKNGPNLSD